MAAKRGTETARTSKGEQTRRALLQAASRLFAENGYHNTSVPDIVRAAGVGHGTFYEYFGSRRAILVELTRQVADTDSRLPRLRSQNLADRIRAEIFWYLSDHVEHLELAKVWHDAATIDPEIAETRRRPPGHRPGDRGRRPHRHARGVRPALVRRGRGPGPQRARRGRRLRDPRGPLAGCHRHPNRHCYQVAGARGARRRS